MRRPTKIKIKREHEHFIREKIAYYRKKVLRHIKNKKLRSFIYGLLSFEMLFYMLFGVGTVFIDITVFSTVHALGINATISNIFSTFAAIVFAYVTNHRWVFKSQTDSIKDTLKEFVQFSEARLFTLVMSTIILILCDIFNGNGYLWKLITVIMTVIINYLLSKLFIFNEQAKEK